MTESKQKDDVKWQMPKPVIRNGFRGFMLKKYTNTPTKEYNLKKDLFQNDMIRKNAYKSTNTQN